MTNFEIPDPPVTIADHLMIQELRRQARGGDYSARRALHDHDRKRAAQRAELVEKRRTEQTAERAARRRVDPAVHTVKRVMADRLKLRDQGNPWDAA